MKTVVCKKCGQQYNINLSANLIVICPQCKCSIYSESEYGFGPIVPCKIYVGDKEIGKIDGRMSCCLCSDVLNIRTALQKGYTNLEVYAEAASIVISKLK